MTKTTTIKDGAFAIGEADQHHSLVANRATTSARISTSRIRKQFQGCFAGAVLICERGQFPAIKPDTATSETVVDFQLVQLQCDQHG